MTVPMMQIRYVRMIVSDGLMAMLMGVSAYRRLVCVNVMRIVMRVCVRMHTGEMKVLVLMTRE